jgi:cysteinyl-tRNA synthetase
VNGCVAAALELEQALQDWVAGTDLSDERDRARTVLRGMLVRLGRRAPLVDALLEWRSAVRTAGDWATGDAIRDVLRTAGVSVRDTPAGPSWSC